MEEDLQRERMVLLGSLLADIVHEMNTPLAAIRSSMDTLESANVELEQWIDGQRTNFRKEELLDIVREALRTHRLACSRLEDLTRSLRTFSRSDSESWQTASLSSIVETALTITAHFLRGRITVTKDFKAECDVQCHPNQLGQVFINLLMNAAQAIQGPGEIRIRTWRTPDRVSISVADSGSGMTSDVMEKLFEQGFTTKSADAGTGLGLSISQRIVQAHGGSISVESQPGKGATFVVEIPILQGERKQSGEL